MLHATAQDTTMIWSRHLTQALSSSRRAARHLTGSPEADCACAAASPQTTRQRPQPCQVISSRNRAELLLSFLPRRNSAFGSKRLMRWASTVGEPSARSRTGVPGPGPNGQPRAPNARSPRARRRPTARQQSLGASTRLQSQIGRNCGDQHKSRHRTVELAGDRTVDDRPARRAS
jgi:hypothetical protein